MTPTLEGKMTYTLLTIYDWRSANLNKLAKIVLRKYPNNDREFKSFSLHYDVKKDAVVAVETRINRASKSMEHGSYLF